jgi:hypothetical protein
MLIYFIAIRQYLPDIWDILWTFGTFCIYLTHFSGFGITSDEKFGNPGAKYPFAQNEIRYKDRISK